MSTRLGVRAVMVAALALFGAAAGSLLPFDGVVHATGLSQICKPGIHCADIVSTSSDCAPTVWCKSTQTNATFPHCMSGGEGCTDDGFYGSINCGEATCQNTIGNICNYTLLFCGP
jgi:hypothetical protein